MKPRDREVVCHASAWNINNVDDLRIKMCIDQTAEDFTRSTTSSDTTSTRAPTRQPMIFRDSANDGFHEAIGDTIALSVTPEYLVKVGLTRHGARRVGRHRPAARGARAPGLPAVRPGRRCVAVAGVQREVTPDSYNAAWWDLRERYQGVGHRRRAARITSIRARSITSRPIRRTRGISSPPSCSSSFTRAGEDGRLRDAAAPLLDLRQRRGGQAAARTTLAMGASGRGPTRSKRSPVSVRWTPPRWRTTSRRSRRGSTSRTRGGSRMVSGPPVRPS